MPPADLAAMGGAVSATGANPMEGMELPAESLHDDGQNPHWQVPEGWVEQSAGSMRRASFLIDDPRGRVEVAVTSFPGDVGGDLANVNRWRQQVGLAPVTADELEEELVRFAVNDLSIAITEIYGYNSAMRAAIIPHGGNTWFVRLSGTPERVRDEGDSFRAFVESIRF